MKKVLPAWGLVDEEGAWLMLAQTWFEARALYCAMKPLEDTARLPPMVLLHETERKPDHFGEGSVQTYSATELGVGCCVLFLDESGAPTSCTYHVVPMTFVAAAVTWPAVPTAPTP